MLRIALVDSLILLDHYHVVRVHTDEGISGFGVVSAMNTQVSDSLVRHALSPLVVGWIPYIERLWHGCTTSPTS